MQQPEAALFNIAAQLAYFMEYKPRASRAQGNCAVQVAVLLQFNK
jgi:hypothetical protein